MYLCDADIKKRLDSINFETTSTEHDFNPEEQIQPASVDLRLSNIFWEPKKQIGTIDLRKSALLELEPRSYWKKKILRSDECITLKPGKLLLARTYEKFSIPIDCAGKIEGRSSFSRLGVGIHTSGDFINPGYRGHMPLQLYNSSPNPIRIFPYIPICQLIFVHLSSLPDNLYGDKEFQSNYMDDDGGPSYWWRDKRIKSLQDTFKSNNLDIEVQEQLLVKVGVQEPEIIKRFERLFLKLRPSEKDNVDLLLNNFSKSEDRLKLRDKIKNGIYVTLFPVFISASIGSAFSKPYGVAHYGLWLFTILSLVPFLLSFDSSKRKYLGKEELSNGIKSCINTGIEKNKS